MIDLIAHLILTGAMIGTLVLFLLMRRDLRESRAAQPSAHLSDIDKRFDRLTTFIYEQHKKTRKESQEIKTRLADEESEDQREKAHDRYIRHRDEQKGGE